MLHGSEPELDFAHKNFKTFKASNDQCAFLWSGCSDTQSFPLKRSAREREAQQPWSSVQAFSMM
jgi:hypothetical protein